jgi:multidrug efflux system membrane fusion protein
VLTGLGVVTPLASITVKTQINGQLQQIAFVEGQFVHRGDILAQIDPRPYQVALEKDEGTLAHDVALLNQARATYVRYQTLGKQDSISRQSVEDQAYLVKQYEGTVNADQGSVDSDKLNLAYCRITSPIDGRIGIRLVDPGTYVQTTDSSGLFIITQLQPISVLFTLPEDDVAQVQQRMAEGSLAVQAYDRTNTRLVATGALATTDNQVDNTTGTVKLRAMFPNGDGALFPQAFVNARLLVRRVTGVTILPQAAIQTGAAGDFVYLLNPDSRVTAQPVKIGVVDGDKVEIVQGLRQGDRVVTDGVDRLRDGAKVNAAANSATPR